MRTTTRNLLALAATASLAVATAGAAPATAKKPPSGGNSDATGRVFMVNPVQSSGDQTLTDQDDARSAVPTSAYATVPLRNLDSSGYLRGEWVVVESSTGTPAYSTTGEYLYYRDEDQFEQVMAYFWVNQAQEYLQSLDFDDSPLGLPGIVNEPFALKVNQYGGDNSYQTDKPYRVRLGKGGVDDAEDAEVIVHEYGHAIHSDQVPGFGASLDAGAIGEGFSDYFAVSVGLAAAEQHNWTDEADEIDEACVADWDATSYAPGPPYCLRRLDFDFKVGDSDPRLQQVHARGTIWSRALWDIRQGYPGLGLTIEDWDTTLIASQFDYAPDTSFQDAAQATYDAAEDDGWAAQQLVWSAFERRGIFGPAS